MVILNEYKNIGNLHVKDCPISLLPLALCHDIDNDERKVVDVNDESLAHDN